MSVRATVLRSIGIFAVILSAASAFAQVEQGRLLGTVKDSQGGVLPGVTVNVTSPALIGNRTAVTETDGRYLVTNLPSGTYTLKFDLQGFQAFVRENVVVTQGSTLTIDATLQVATLNESVTVTGESPVVDTTSTKVGATFSGEALVGVPSSTDLWGNLAQTPGVRMQGYDVGGSHKSQQTGYDAFGIRGQTKTMFEGIDTTEGDSGAFFYADYYAVSEVSVTAIGGDVETSSPGATNVQNFKSGGNAFSGLEHVTYEPTGSLMANNVDDATRARGFTGNPNLAFSEFHVELGGPLVHDKLWFYGAFNKFHLEQRISGVDPAVATDITDVTDPMLKLTWRTGGKDTFVGFLMPRNNKVKPNRGLSASTLPEAGTRTGQQDVDQEIRVAARLVEPAVLRRARRRVLRSVADVHQGRSRREAADLRQRNRTRQRCGLGCLFARLRQASNARHIELFPADPQRKPRSEVRVRVPSGITTARRSTGSLVRFSISPGTDRPIRFNWWTWAPSPISAIPGSPDTTTTPCSRCSRRIAGRRRPS